MLVPPRLSPRRTHAAVIAGCLVLSSCGGGSGTEVSPPTAQAQPARPVEFSDLQIAQLIYDGTPRTPSDFFQEAQPPGPSHVSTRHLKNTDLDATLTDSTPQYELCADNWNDALSWSETSAQQAGAYADLVATNDDARFYEFGRSRAGDPDFYVRERVFKCSYLNRTAADLRLPEGDAGQLNQRPVTAEELRALAEYLWQFTTYNNFGHAVLKSSGAVSPGSLTHTLIIATLEHGGISATCDRIDVIAWRHAAETTSGALQLDLETLWSFGARESGGNRELCSG